VQWPGGQVTRRYRHVVEGAQEATFRPGRFVDQQDRLNQDLAPRHSRPDPGGTDSSGTVTAKGKT